MSNDEGMTRLRTAQAGRARSERQNQAGNGALSSFGHSGLVSHWCFVIFSGRPRLKFGIDIGYAFCDEDLRRLGSTKRNYELE